MATATFTVRPPHWWQAGLEQGADGSRKAPWPHRPLSLPGWRAGPKHTHDSQLSAAAPAEGHLGALLLAEVDAIVLELDPLDGEGGDGAVLALHDAALVQQQWLGLQVHLPLPEPAHGSQVLCVAPDFHRGTPFPGYEARVLPDAGARASCGRQGQDQHPAVHRPDRQPHRGPPPLVAGPWLSPRGLSLLLGVGQS